MGRVCVWACVVKSVCGVYMCVCGVVFENLFMYCK